MTTIPRALIDRLATARSVVALTGAGVSAESGVPTFRDAMTGIWARFDPMQLATPEAFERDPERVTRWYDERRLRALAVKPNPGHVALAAMQVVIQRRGGRFTLVTQNVDRLHQRAGSCDVAELHGSIDRWRCTGCGAITDEHGPAFASYPPRCPSCGGAKRPDVVWFGEALPPEALMRATREAAACDLYFTIGTSAVVYPAAGLLDLAIDAGAMTVELTRDPTPATRRVTHALPGLSGEILPALAAVLTDRRT